MVRNAHRKLNDFVVGGDLIGSIWGERLKTGRRGRAAASSSAKAAGDGRSGLICSYARALLIYLSQGKHKVHFQVTDPPKEGKAPKRSRSWRNGM